MKQLNQNKKAIELTLQTIVVFIIVLVVLIVIIVYFINNYDPSAVTDTGSNALNSLKNLS